MKKLFLLFLTAFMLSLTAGAVELGPNQKLLGHYTTDDLATTGWGQGYLMGVNIIGTDLTPDELAVFQGSQIVAFRVGLVEAAPISRLFVIPVDPNGNPTNDVTEWPVNVDGQPGWNMIEVETPYVINLPDGYSLRIGFDYEQIDRNAKPISAVKVGTVYPSYIYRNSRWMNYGVNTFGNLGLQCVAYNENFPEYVIRGRNLTSNTNFVVGDNLNFRFEICNLGAGQVDAGDITFDVAIDGTVVKTISNPAALTSTYSAISDAVGTDNLTGGAHTLTVTMATLKGEPVVDPMVLTASFKVFDFGFSRQMRLVEQFTSTYCTYCPQGTANIVNLTNMRNDIAWVAVHENMGGTDPYHIAQSDTVRNLQGIDGYPEGTFDRTAGISSANGVYAVLTNLSAATMSAFLDHITETPSWATVNVNSTFDAHTRKATITIDGDLVPNYEDFMGSDSRLTVYITEDGLVAPQLNSGIWINDYVHNNVFRKALVSVRGVALKKTGDSYKNEFTIDIPEEWNADNLNIVAFISRPLGNALTDIYVTNANKRKLGESDAPAVMRGDVDGDEEVTISDVTALIDYLLSGTEAPEAADCDLDNEVAISDVTTLIDYLLSGVWPE